MTVQYLRLKRGRKEGDKGRRVGGGYPQLEDQDNEFV